MSLSLTQLQEYTQDKNHHGLNKMEILLIFIEYLNQCQDPQHIFRFMQQKAICTFISQFWLCKADYFAQIGQYRLAFQYLQEAQSRNGIGQDDKQRFIDMQSRNKKMLEMLINDIRNFPLKSKRSNEEYDLISNQSKNLKQKQKRQKILKLYESKYAGLQKQKQQNAISKRKNFSKSWLYEIYQKQDSKEMKLESMAHENSNKLSKEHKNHTMQTPVRYRDPQRLTKTMDSVQILKKKKSTNEKSKKNARLNSNIDSDSERVDDWDVQDSSKMITSVPVGRKFTQLKRRRVTFDMSGKIVPKKLLKDQSNGQSSSFYDKSANNSNSILKSKLIKNQKNKQKSEVKTKQLLQQRQKQIKNVKFQSKK